MKKTLLILAISFFTICVSAQTAFGIKAGVNSASMSVDAEDTFGDGWSKAIHPLITASFLTQIELSYRTNLTMELGLVQKGFKIKISEGGNDGEVSMTFNQIQFSPGIAFNASDEFSIGLGPYIGYAAKYKLKAKITIDGDNDTITDTDTADFDDEEKLDYGVNVDLNYVSYNGLLLSAGYSLGLKDYNNDSDSDVYTNSGIMISIGYLFN